MTRNRRHIKATKSAADNSLLLQPSSVSRSPETCSQDQHCPTPTTSNRQQAQAPDTNVVSSDIDSFQSNTPASTSSANASIPNLLKRLLPYNKSGTREQGPLRPRR